MLDEIFQKANIPNWDGYNAQPISKGTLNKAQEFLRALPSSTPSPEVGVDPDGDISFDWDDGRGNIFSLSINGSGRLAYAGIFGENGVHGDEQFVDVVPASILEHLRRLLT